MTLVLCFLGVAALMCAIAYAIDRRHRAERDEALVLLRRERERMERLVDAQAARARRLMEAEDRTA